jgi:predicted ester cyclase/heme-degrading monooxygenase HmoA
MCYTQATDNINENTKNKEVNMSVIESNKEVVRKLYEQCLNKRNMALLQDFVSEDYVGIGGEKGSAAFEVPVAALIKALPDIQWKIEEIMGEGDKVVVRWKVQGTHTGPFQHFTATGNTVSNDGIGIYELKDGKIINAQVHTDRLGFLQQLEVLPSDLTLLSNKKAHKDHIRFIDKFLVPEKAKEEFMERVNINRNFIKTLPGFIEDAAYERTDEHGHLIFVTVAVWENEEALKKAKEAVQAEYEKQSFDPAAMFERLHISMDRGTYQEAIP